MLGFVFRRLVGSVGKRPYGHVGRRTRYRPRLETLECRCTPAVLHVGPREPFTTIQAAVNAAHNGDQIRVDPGTYQEQVTINKSIDLEGTGNATTILAPTNLGVPTVTNPDAIVRVTGAGTSAEIGHLTIAGAAAGTANLYYGVRVDGNAFADVEHDTITNIIDAADATIGVGIDVGNSTGSPDGTGPQVGSADIAHDTISNYQRVGIVINNSGSSAEVENNTITASATFNTAGPTGVEVSDGAVAAITNNAISGNSNGSSGAGVALFSPGVLRLPDFDSDPNDFFIITVANNKITGNDYGVFGSQVTSSLTGQPASATVNNNQIAGNTYVGIEFDNSANVTINNNHVTGNGSDNTADGGIYLFQSSNNTLANNICANNDGSGIYLDAGSTGNLVRNNQLHNNVFDTTAGNADAVDLSTGTGTAGTANTWLGNHGETFIDQSSQSLIMPGPGNHP